MRIIVTSGNFYSFVLYATEKQQGADVIVRSIRNYLTPLEKKLVRVAKCFGCTYLLKQSFIYVYMKGKGHHLSMNAQVFAQLFAVFLGSCFRSESLSPPPS